MNRVHLRVSDKGFAFKRCMESSPPKRGVGYLPDADQSITLGKPSSDVETKHLKSTCNLNRHVECGIEPTMLCRLYR